MAETDAPQPISALLVGMERYNPSNIEPLEAFVEEQCAQNIYDLDANLALLKFGLWARRNMRSGNRYQFNPAQTNIDTIAKILLKALMQLPANDFSLYLSLLNDQVLEFEPLPQIVDLLGFLETAQYQQFWTAAAELESVTSSITGFEDAVRQAVAVASLDPNDGRLCLSDAAIAVTVAITFQTTTTGLLGALLNLPDARALGEFVQELGWRYEADGSISIPLGPENQAKAESATERVKFEQLTKLIGSSI